MNVQSGPRARWTWYIVGIMLAIAEYEAKHSEEDFTL